MRKCIRCGAEMVEGCAVRQTDTACGIVIMESDRLFAHSLGKPKAAVCPECGEVSLYIEDLDKVRKFMESGRRGSMEK